MLLVVLLLLVVSIAEMLLTVNTSNLCKSLVEVLPDPLPVSRPALALRTTEMRSPGNEVRQVDLRLGAAVTKILTKEDRQLPGPENVVAATRINRPVMEVIATTARHMVLVLVLQAQALPLHGNNKLPEPRLAMPVILATLPTVLLLEWALLLVLVLPVVHHHLLQVLPQVWVTLTLSSSSTLAQLLLPRHLPATLHHLLPVTSLRLLHLPVLR
jgi:hypothetical protein